MNLPLCSYIDHTLLRPDASQEEIKKLCEEVLQYGFASACVLPYWVPYARSILKTATLCSVVGFPLGSNATPVKAFEAKQLVKQGVTELDMVICIPALKQKNFSYVLDDIRAVVEMAEGALVKVIIETCYLSDDEKKDACSLSVEAGAHYVKTSTGFAKGGATIDDVMLMRSVVDKNVGVKASGGIKDTIAALAMIKAGANRIGTSSGIAIIAIHEPS